MSGIQITGNEMLVMADLGLMLFVIIPCLRKLSFVWFVPDLPGVVCDYA